MAHGFAKGLMVGCALSLAVGAVAYSQAGALRPLKVQHPLPVSSDPAPLVDQSVAVSAFVGSTTMMARPAIATSRDIARAETLTVALDAEIISLSANERNDDLVNETVETPDFLSETDPTGGLSIPSPMMRPRPATDLPVSVLAVNTPDPVVGVTLPTRPSDPQLENRKIRKGLRWSTGEFR